VLETLEFTRVGSNEPRKTDVRVIAATNRDLGEAVRRGKFRQDLYYRLHSAQIRIPPLREREGDIPLLIAFYAARVSARLGIPFQGLTHEALELLMSYDWPGNVRELRNFMELVITIERGGKITEEIAAKHLDLDRRPPVMENPNAIVHLAGKTSEQVERELIYRALIDLRNEVSSLKQIILNSVDRVESTVQRPALPPPPSAPQDPLERVDDLNLSEIERRVIQLALKRHGNNRRQAAQELGISERTLYRKLEQYVAPDDRDDKPREYDGSLRE
jgi:DNA-binding NtrC family response regulator